MKGLYRIFSKIKTKKIDRDSSVKEMNKYESIFDDEDFIELSKMSLNDVKNKLSNELPQVDKVMDKIKGDSSKNVLSIDFHKDKSDRYHNILMKFDREKNKREKSNLNDIKNKKLKEFTLGGQKIKIIGICFVILLSSSYTLFQMNPMRIMSNISDDLVKEKNTKSQTIFQSFYVSENDTFNEIIKKNKWGYFYNKELFSYFNSISLGDEISLMKDGKVIHIDHFLKRDRKKYSYVLVDDFVTRFENKNNLFLSVDEINLFINKSFYRSVLSNSLFNGNEPLARKTAMLALDAQNEENNISKLKDGAKVFLYIISLKDKKNGSILDIKNVKIKSIDHNRYPSSNSVAVTGL